MPGCYPNLKWICYGLSVWQQSTVSLFWFYFLQSIVGLVQWYNQVFRKKKRHVCWSVDICGVAVYWHWFNRVWYLFLIQIKLPCYFITITDIIILFSMLQNLANFISLSPLLYVSYLAGQACFHFTMSSQNLALQIVILNIPFVQYITHNVWIYVPQLLLKFNSEPMQYSRQTHLFSYGTLIFPLTMLHIIHLYL